MDLPIDINCRAVRVKDEFELIDSPSIASRIAVADQRSAQRLLTPPVYYSLANGIVDDRAINDALLATAKRIGSRAFGVVEPKYGTESTHEIVRLASLGALGLVWSPRAQGIFGNDVMLAQHILEGARSGLVSMIHGAPYSINETLWRLWALAGQLDGAPLVVLGAFESWEAIQLVRDNRGGPANVFYDLSAMSEGYDLDHLYAAMGAERLLLGSGGGDGIEATLGVLERSTLPGEAQDAIRRGNAARLFRLAETVR